MGKRFTDTEKWKKSFLRGLQGPYKLLWFYLLDDCDMAGIWQVDLEVARIRIGEQIDGPTALRAFGDRVTTFDNGKKWFLRDFIFFQYGELKETNRMHLAVINTLRKNNLNYPQGPSEGLPSPQGQGIIQGYGKGQGNGGAGGKIEKAVVHGLWETWGDQIVNDEDILWGHGDRSRKVPREEMDAFLSVATRNDWKMESQESFRRTLKGFDWKKGANGTTTKQGVDMTNL